jgi:hypothetical protein
LPDRPDKTSRKDGQIAMSLTAMQNSDVPARPAWTGRGRPEILVAAAAFAVLCVVALSVRTVFLFPDAIAYQASIIAMTQGHFLTLSSSQLHAVLEQMASYDRPPPRVSLRFITTYGQWVSLPGGRFISQKDPGYPFLAAPFQALGIIRLAPLFYGALGCLGLFFGARRWLGRFGGAAAVGLFCSSGAVLVFAYSQYMPTFTEASLIAAGAGALLWAVLATEASPRRRTWAGLLGFVAIDAAVFCRYSNIVVLGCAVLAVLAAWRLPGTRLPAAALGWWLGSVAVFGAGVAVFDDLAYGGPLRTSYPPGLITFSLGAVLPNVRHLPMRLIVAMPVLVLGLVALAWIIWRWIRWRRAVAEPAAVARRDLAVGLALAAAWFTVWGLYALYTWTTTFSLPGALFTVDDVRFYVDPIGPIVLLAAWLVTRVPRRASLAPLTSAAVVAAMFGLGVWFQLPVSRP